MNNPRIRMTDIKLKKPRSRVLFSLEMLNRISWAIKRKTYK
jgi:hypothetical protein